MSKKIIFSLPGNEGLTSKLIDKLQIETGAATVRHFPDGETFVQIHNDVKGKDVILVCTLDRPDDKLLPLYFMSCTLRELGAAKITLVAPYLAYMRQDKRFHSGEAVTSVWFAKLISGMVDELITVDPHLHRRSNLNEIYSIPSKVLHAAPLISSWIKANIPNAVLVGPDEESEQWVKEVAAGAGAPYFVLRKNRKGDSDVEVFLPEVSKYKNFRPVLVDDIISTARTMVETVLQLKKAGFQTPVKLGVHGIFAGTAELALFSTDAETITTNTIPHHTNRIDISALIAAELK